MPLQLDAEPLSLPVPWMPWNGGTPIIVFRLPKGWADEHFGPPAHDDPSGAGLGHESAWAFRFPCGLECVLELIRETPEWRQGLQWLSVVVERPEFEHVLRHLGIPREWVKWDARQTPEPNELVQQAVREQTTWSVWRQDDNGNRFFMEHAASEADAQCIARTFGKRGHKQLYWVEPTK